MLDLTSVHATDIMEKDVVQLHTLTRIEAAIETLEEYSIQGAPVVDEAEELVGVLSATDILKRDNAHDEEVRRSRSGYYSADPLFDADDFFGNKDYFFGNEDYSPELLGRELVVDWMTPRVISVKPDASLAEICSLFDKERIHRVFVVENGRAVGVISTFDIVKRLAAEEDAQVR